MDLDYAERNDIGLKYLRDQLTDQERDDFELLLMSTPALVDQLKLEDMFLKADVTAYASPSSTADVVAVDFEKKDEKTVDPAPSTIEHHPATVSGFWRPLAIAASLATATLAVTIVAPRGGPSGNIGFDGPRSINPVVLSRARGPSDRFDAQLSISDTQSITLLAPLIRPTAATYTVHLINSVNPVPILTITGAPVSSAGGIFLELPTEPLEKGIYMLKIWPDGQIESNPVLRYEIELQ